MTDADRRGGLATAIMIAWMGALFLAGAWLARYVVFVIWCVLEYRKGK